MCTWFQWRMILIKENQIAILETDNCICFSLPVYLENLFNRLSPVCAAFQELLIAIVQKAYFKSQLYW